MLGGSRSPHRTERSRAPRAAPKHGSSSARCRPRGPFSFSRTATCRPQPGARLLGAGTGRALGAGCSVMSIDIGVGRGAGAPGAGCAAPFVRAAVRWEREPLVSERHGESEGRIPGSPVMNGCWFKASASICQVRRLARALSAAFSLTLGAASLQHATVSHPFNAVVVRSRQLYC